MWGTRQVCKETGYLSLHLITPFPPSSDNASALRPIGAPHYTLLSTRIYVAAPTAPPTNYHHPPHRQSPVTPNAKIPQLTASPILPCVKCPAHYYRTAKTSTAAYLSRRRTMTSWPYTSFLIATIPLTLKPHQHGRSRPWDLSGMHCAGVCKWTSRFVAHTETTG